VVSSGRFRRNAARESTMLRRTLLVATLLLPAVAPGDDGKQMYGKKCLACHALDGSGDKPLGKKVGTPDLRVSTLGQEQVERVIADGRGKMLPYKDKLNWGQISDLAAYVLEFRTPAAPPAKPTAATPANPPKP
jgi:mono/diheme cytochrome c family protein